MIYSRITGTGSYLPEKVLTNKDLEKMVDTTDEWIFERTGIRERHIVEMESASDMAEHAARRALEMAGKKPEDVDLIIVGTSTPDLVFPSTACLLQSNLGIRNGGAAFDVQAACSGFVFALSVADKFIRTGTSKCALVVGAEAMSKILDWDRPGNLHPVRRWCRCGGAGSQRRAGYPVHPPPCRWRLRTFAECQRAVFHVISRCCVPKAHCCKCAATKFLRWQSIP